MPTFSTGPQGADYYDITSGVPGPLQGWERAAADLEGRINRIEQQTATKFNQVENKMDKGFSDIGAQLQLLCSGLTSAGVLTQVPTPQTPALQAAEDLIVDDSSEADGLPGEERL